MALTPMMRQYLEIHEKYPDCLLFFRLGDFYELFFEDAKTASKELELTLTGKDCGLEERAPMCGVPYHAVNTYLDKLISLGYKVAICEQMEDPALAKGLVERDVIRVVTAGTVTDPEMLSEKVNNFLCSCYLSEKGDACALAVADVSTGEFFVSEPPASQLRGEIFKVAPSEILSSADTAQELRDILGVEFRVDPQPSVWFRPSSARTVLEEHFSLRDLTPLGMEDHPAAISAAGALLRYLRETQKTLLSHITNLNLRDSGSVMMLDPHTRRNLELTESLRGRSKKGTLLSLLDHTATAMGGRLLRSWIEEPLISAEAINARHDAVEELATSPLLRASVRDELENVYDCERLLSKVSYKSLNARDCLALCQSLKRIPAVKSLLGPVKTRELREIRDGLDPLEELTAWMDRAIHPEPPVVLTEGGLIRDGYNAELDEYHAAQTNGRQWILDLEARERSETGIKNLRVQYNRVFGYYIEVTKSFLSLVPERYTRKQTLANAERYMTPELKEIEQKIIGAQEQSTRLELRLFNEIRDAVAEHLREIQSNCACLKKLDVYQSLSDTAQTNHYVRPVMTTDGTLSIREGRHPVVEQTQPEGAFVANDTLLDTGENRMMIITGPNMAGKSTYMRQVALICLMAQIGSFVPADEAMLPVCDKIFTRVGASDDLAGGQSTFMVEMSETANILRNATKDSLIILDEIGRGTSTFDGLAIAWAVVEYIADQNRIGAKTLFATHYHELSELEGHLDGVKNYCSSVKEHGEDVIFLRKIIRGGADKSFGVQVARLAGIPHPVIVRAHEIQARLEVSDINQNSIGQNILGTDEKPRMNEQVSLFEYKKTEIIDELQNIDVMSLTPIDAMNKLFLLREKARKL